MGLCSSENGWDCARQNILGWLSVLAVIASVVALNRMIRMWAKTNWYILNIVMVVLALLQTLFSAITFLIVDEPHLSLSCKLVRQVQGLVTALLYGRLALESLGRPHLIRRLLLPACGGILAYLLAIYFTATFTGALRCDHVTWVLLSISGFLLALGFAISGYFVMHTIRQVAMASNQAALQQRMHQIVVLVAANAMSAVAEMVIDAYMLHHSINSGTCEPDSGAPGAELLRLLLRLGSYQVPVWVTLYVFYWVPRHQMNADLDVALTMEPSHRTGAPMATSLFDADGGLWEADPDNNPFFERQ